MSTKVIFLGTPSFALASLSALHGDHDFEIIAVITQPDRPAGRGQEISVSPVKRLAETFGLKVLQPERIRNYSEEIRALAPDLIVVVAYGQLIPQSILDIPKFGCINVHGSLLPKYRGAAVIQAPIINGDTETGVTIMLMDAGLDTGPILAQSSISLDQTETAATLFVKLAALGAELLVPTLKKYLSGQLMPRHQDERLASKVGLLTKQDGLIDWNASASEIERRIRAMYPWPVAFTTWSGKTLKILEVDKTELNIKQYEPGTTFVHNDDLAVQCGINALKINRLQLEGKTAMSGSEFLRGNSRIIHQVLT
jgi:methionyl-tRNA formyltransferase